MPLALWEAFAWQMDTTLLTLMFFTLRPEKSRVPRH